MSSKKPLAPWCSLSRAELDQLVRKDKALLFEAISSLRERKASRQYSRLDRLLGLAAGTVSRVVRDEKTLDLDRLLGLIRLLGETPREFFTLTYPESHDPSPPIGLLTELIEPNPRIPTPAWRDHLSTWAETVEISDDGAPFQADPKDLIAFRLRDSEAAERFGIGGLEFFLTFSRGTLARASVVPLAKWLTSLAFISRIRGDHSTAAELCEISLRIEEAIDDPGCRSFILRNASYLLSDIGHLSHAQSFAGQAIRLATDAADLPGIGLSYFASATISLYQGRTAMAAERYAICLKYLAKDQHEPIASTHQAMATLHLDQLEPDAAGTHLEKIDEVLFANSSQATRAKIILTRGEWSSQTGLLGDAENFFNEASERFSQLGSVTDVALVGLFVARHYTRHGRDSLIEPHTNSLLALSNDPRLDKIGQATLVEIARLYHRGDAGTEILTRFIREWRHAAGRISKP